MADNEMERNAWMLRSVDKTDILHSRERIRGEDRNNRRNLSRIPDLEFIEFEVLSFFQKSPKSVVNAAEFFSYQKAEAGDEE